MHLRLRRPAVALVASTLAAGVLAAAPAHAADEGTISGVVTGPAGTAGALGVLLVGATSDADANAYWPGWQILSYVDADTSGAYSIPGVPAGTYRVAFVPENPDTPGASAIEWYADQPSPYSATEVVVAPGQVISGLNATVAAGSTIAGTVTDAAGNPQTTTQVTALTKVGQEWKPAFSARTDPTGSYAIHGLSASTYRIRFDSYGPDDAVAVTEYWQDKGLLSNATSIALTAGQTVGGVDARMVAGEHAGERKRVVQNTAAPTISGSPAVGSTLTASTGTWSPTPTAYAMQWMRDGQPILGAVGSTYVPTEADLGARLTVAVTASEVDSDSASALSAATAPVQPSQAAARAALARIVKKLKLTGKAKVGRTAKVKGLSGSFRAEEGTQVRYRLQWYAGSTKIKKATKSRLKLKASVRGKKISVKVTASAAGAKVSRKLVLGKAR